MLEMVLLEAGHPVKYQGDVFRIVETQEYVATTRLVDTIDEQELLEQLLDGVKPPYRKGTEALHYLISTPFRYPPLEYGSRFGTVCMPSYFYACEEVGTVLAECAFYRFLFMSDIRLPYGKPVDSDHMSFSVSVRAESVADLTCVRDGVLMAMLELESPADYSLTQAVGQTFLDKGADMIRFYSARCKKGVNVAISTPEVIMSNRPENCLNWICRTTSDVVSFNTQGERPVSFNLSDFLVAGHLPRPA